MPPAKASRLHTHPAYQRFLDGVEEDILSKGEIVVATVTRQASTSRIVTHQIVLGANGEPSNLRAAGERDALDRIFGGTAPSIKRKRDDADDEATADEDEPNDDPDWVDEIPAEPAARPTRVTRTDQAGRRTTKRLRPEPAPEAGDAGPSSNLRPRTHVRTTGPVRATATARSAPRTAAAARSRPLSSRATKDKGKDKAAVDPVVDGLTASMGAIGVESSRQPVAGPSVVRGPQVAAAAQAGPSRAPLRCHVSVYDQETSLDAGSPIPVDQQGPVPASVASVADA